MVETVLGMTDLQIKLFTAGGQLAVAIAVAYVAWRQAKTARNKLKVDLFDKRFALVKELRRRIDRIRAEQIGAEDFLTLPELAREMEYLFDSAVKKNCETLVGFLTKLHRLQAHFNDTHRVMEMQNQRLREVRRGSLSKDVPSEEQILLLLKDSSDLLGGLSQDMAHTRAEVDRRMKELQVQLSNFLKLEH
ncbi:hypothetical protein CEK00_04765 [Stenotrophomonas maltophilia]|uniref:Transmembrane protein n=1 Tax=Stenotrophomonas maltophilia TaxID=40324 RepID=A0A270NPH8_STEMA|nr:hypothetical protein [Stenotrophomonas maltophilia]PAM73162.1 hypothetical protein CEK00_04765 [Stenotrophomonas maltophilia]